MLNNLKYIRETAKKKEKENVRFRSFLKFCDTPEEEIDSMVRHLYQEASREIDCTVCGNCCKEIKPQLNEEDILKISKGLGIDATKLKEKYLTKTDTANVWTFNKLPCPFLNGSVCACYEYRPKDCAEYPHLDKDGFIWRLWGVIENCSVCPRVFNVYENLKKMIKR